MKKFWFLFMVLLLLLLLLPVVGDAACGGRSGRGTGRIHAFLASHQAKKAVYHQTMADHHAARHDRIQSRRATMQIQLAPSMQSAPACSGSNCPLPGTQKMEALPAPQKKL